MQKIYYLLHILHFVYNNLLISKFHILDNVYCDQVITVIFFLSKSPLLLWMLLLLLLLLTTCYFNFFFRFNGMLASFSFIKWYVLFHTFANLHHSAHEIQNPHNDVRSTVPSWNPLQTFSTKITVRIWIEGRSIVVIITIVVVADKTYLFPSFLYQIWMRYFFLLHFILIWHCAPFACMDHGFFDWRKRVKSKTCIKGYMISDCVILI